MKVGIIGLGNFGQLAARVLVQDGNLEVMACDAAGVAPPSGVQEADLAGMAQADVVVLCVPLSAYETLLPQVAAMVRPDTLVVDICSVKVEAEKRLRQHLPVHRNLLVTHPLFGPQSATNGVRGLTLVVTDAQGEVAEAAIGYCQQKLGLKIVRMTSEEHDREMARVHALSFFIARALTDMGVRAGKFDPPSFQWLLNLAALDKAHSDDLFRTMEIGNPYAKSSREKFVKTLQKINEQLEKEKL